MQIVVDAVVQLSCIATARLHSCALLSRATRSLSNASQSLIVMSCLLAAASAAGEELESPGGYRVDRVPKLVAGAPDALEVTRPGSSAPWPAPVAQDLRERVMREWATDQQYGPIEVKAGVWLEGSLVTAAEDGSVVVPVLEADEIPIRGRVSVPGNSSRRRLIVLLDVSESANRTTYVRTAGEIEKLTVLQAGLRTTRRLIDLVIRRQETISWFSGYQPDELGVIAFGEGTWPIAEPGDPLEQTRERLTKFDASRVAEDPFAQLRLSEARSEIDAARERVLGNFAAMFALACEGAEIPLERRARYRYDAANATARGVRAVDLLFESSGGRGIFCSNPIQRAFRDVHAARAHFINNPERSAQVFGRSEFGLPPADFFL